MNVESSRFDESRLLAGLQILVIDNDADSTAAYQIFFEEEGATVVSANSCTEAIAALDSTQPNIILADLWMPDGDGFSLLQEIQARLLKPIPSIAVTADPRPEIHEQALRAGFTRVVLKPVSLDQLILIIDELTASDL
jgi:CheY-like chemotaxis protein